MPTLTMTPVQFDTIPHALKAYRQWVMYRREERDGKVTKVPYSPVTKKKASVTNPADWATFDEAAAACNAGEFDGVGFVLTKGDPFTGIDLDRCVDLKTGVIEPWAIDIIDRLNSYTEYSPSKTGLRVFVLGTLPPGRRRKEHIELYDTARYLTCTGHHLPGTPLTIEDRHATLQLVHAEHFPSSKSNDNPSRKAMPILADDETQLALMLAAKNGAKIKRLLEGSWSGEHPSQSEADFALCRHLAFWFGRDPERMDRIFRQSGLMREKWDSPRGASSYGLDCITNACDMVRDTYEGKAVIASALVSKGTSGMNDTPSQSTTDEQATKEEPPTGLASALLEYATLVTLDLPTRKHHLPWLPEGGNVMVFGWRGTGKTWFQLGLGASLVTGTDFLAWKTGAPVGVLYIDGEMPLTELRKRMTALLPGPPKAPLHFLSSEMVYHKLHRDLVLSSEAVREEILSILDAHPEIRVLIFDNISTLFTGIDEDKKSEWEPIAGWFIRLRHRGLATILVHHAGKGGQQRGTSGREDALDTVIHLDWPSTYEADEGCHFELKFTKSRSVKGDEVGPLDVKLSEENGVLTWAHTALEQSKEDQVKELLAAGVTSDTEIAAILKIDRSYVWKLRQKIKNGGKK